ncbi:FtsX-like permease family protein [Bacillus sp. 1P06AnD]|uniref:ABC transporter permease n=1 Tax=Bacillus sp. 1P06AnD TaxID=3132208 RepID=UPI0039A132E3
MFFKLSARNVKRSFKDYFIYFLTLTFAVCIFYSFNSLSDQKAMMDLSANQTEIIGTLTQLISGISVFVSIVLGFLIIFANNFLIKRRKKELGLYMSLGMGKYKISRVLVVETLFVGMISLVTGLLFGIALSQGLSVLTASLFEVNITKFQFIFSSDAMVKTILYFGLIFICVMVFNSFIISKYKLIDLLTASRKNQTLKIRKTSTSVVLFLLSVLLLGVAYSLMLKYGIIESMSLTWACVGMGAAGTFLFFMSLSGFLLTMVKNNKNIYFKDVNMFILRQINSKVNTTFVSMTIICLMLFFTIGVLSTGFSMKNSMEGDLEKSTPFDATIYKYYNSQEPLSIDEALVKMNVDPNTLGDHHSITVYHTEETLNKWLTPYKDKKSEKFINDSYKQPINAVSYSDYKRVAELQGVKPEALKPGGMILISNVTGLEPTINRFANDIEKVSVNGKEYEVPEAVTMFSMMTDFQPFDTLTVVLPDNALTSMKTYLSAIDIQYKGNKEKHDQMLYDLADKFTGRQADPGKYDLFLQSWSKTMVYETKVGAATTFVFLGIYLGIVFLISSAAILALQQLSEASDNLERYRMLKKIGVTKKSINRSIFWQIFIYFMMPLALAIVHSVFGIQVVNQLIVLFGESSVLIPSLITGLILIIVYGGYFLATYTGYKNIVK